MRDPAPWKPVLFKTRAGNVELQLVQARRVARASRKSARQHLDAQGNALHVFFDFSRSDDDFVQHIVTHLGELPLEVQ